jgi:pyruvate dehydrogenase E2 component (dihydrolipoamide acetyltransferase)
MFRRSATLLTRSTCCCRFEQPPERITADIRPRSILTDQIRVPNLGVSVTEVVISAWLKKVDDDVVEGDVICEVEADKSSAEVTAPSSGRLTQILANVGATVRIGDTIARVEPSAQEDAEGSPALAQSSAETSGPKMAEPAIVEDSTGVAGGHRILSTPIARELAKHLELDISTVATQRGEPVRKADVLAVMSAARSVVKEFGLPREYEEIQHRDEPLNSIQKAMSERLTQSAAIVAHMTMQVDVDMLGVETARNEHNALGTDSVRLTALSFVARAAVSVLAKHPRLNASVVPGALRQWVRINLGVAVDTPRGLVVPVIGDASRLGVEAIAEAIRWLASAARDRRLRPEDVFAPTFTISNPGAFGAVEAPAIISLPQVATLGMAAIVRVPRVVVGADGVEHILVRPVMRAALTYDHRVLDGGDAGRYLRDLKQALETWSRNDYLS